MGDLVAEIRDLKVRMEALERGETTIAIEPPKGSFVSRDEFDNAMILIHGLVGAVDELRFDLDAARARVTLIEGELDEDASEGIAHLDPQPGPKYTDDDNYPDEPVDVAPYEGEEGG